MSEQYPQRTQFLKNFILEVIKQKSKKLIEKPKEITYSLNLTKFPQEEIESPKIIEPLPIPLVQTASRPTENVLKKEQTQKNSTKNESLFNVINQIQPRRVTPPTPKQVRIMMPPKPYLISTQTPPIRQKQPSQNLPTPMPSAISINLESLSKINNLMQDPIFQSIECPGPGKPLIITRGGLIQTLPITLTKEEIDSVLQETSQKTRIPLTKGIFTAALGDKILNAVISDFVGSRFIIQKKNITANQ